MIKKDVISVRTEIVDHTTIVKLEYDGEAKEVTLNLIAAMNTNPIISTAFISAVIVMGKRLGERPCLSNELMDNDLFKRLFGEEDVFVCEQVIQGKSAYLTITAEVEHEDSDSTIVSWEHDGDFDTLVHAITISMLQDDFFAHIVRAALRNAEKLKSHQTNVYDGEEGYDVISPKRPKRRRSFWDWYNLLVLQIARKRKSRSITDSTPMP